MDGGKSNPSMAPILFGRHAPVLKRTVGLVVRLIRQCASEAAAFNVDVDVSHVHDDLLLRD